MVQTTYYELCVAANEWNNARKLLWLLTLFKGYSHGQYFSCWATMTRDMYAYLKKAMMEKLNPDTDENCLVALKQLRLRQFREGCESLDELTQDLERMLDKSSLGLPAKIHKTEL